MAMHWRTLLHCALMVLASCWLAGMVAIAPAQQSDVPAQQSDVPAQPLGASLQPTGANSQQPAATGQQVEGAAQYPDAAGQLPTASVPAMIDPNCTTYLTPPALGHAPSADPPLTGPAVVPVSAILPTMHGVESGLAAEQITGQPPATFMQAWRRFLQPGRPNGGLATATAAPAGQQDMPPTPAVVGSVSMAAALENPAHDHIIASDPSPPQVLPPGTFEELGRSGEPGPPAVPLNDPAQAIDNLPAIMVPNSPFLPLATQPEPVTWLPVISEPWSQRPLAAGMFAGILWGDVSMGRHVRIDSGLFYGGRFGWDFDDRWAWEGRVAFATINVEYPGTDIPSRNGDAILWDLQLHMAIFARPRLKTYFAFGGGMGFFDLVDHQGVAIDETLVTVPIGLGMKYRYDDWIVFRLDLADNLSLGKRSSGLSDVHNLSLVGGLEIRFGGYQRDYWPWSLR